MIKLGVKDSCNKKTKKQVPTHENAEKHSFKFTHPVIIKTQALNNFRET
jgi:hypothetical protein